jgi:hypothetical protein
MPTSDVDDGQTAVPEYDPGRGVHAFIVGAAMRDAAQHAGHRRRIDRAPNIESCNSRDSTH